jgi:hypothetical protein
MTAMAPFAALLGVSATPGGRDIRRGEAPISRILVPRDKGRIGRFLDKEIAAPAQDVGAEHILDGVQDPGVTHETGEKRKEEMRLVAQVAAERPAHLRLDRLELLAKRERLVLRHDRDRREIARFVVLRDLCFGQQFRHGSAPPGNEPVIPRVFSVGGRPEASTRIAQPAPLYHHRSGLSRTKL